MASRGIKGDGSFKGNGNGEGFKRWMGVGRAYRTHARLGSLSLRLKISALKERKKKDRQYEVSLDPYYS